MTFFENCSAVIAVNVAVCCYSFTSIYSSGVFASEFEEGDPIKELLQLYRKYSGEFLAEFSSDQIDFTNWESGINIANGLNAKFAVFAAIQ